MKEWRRGIRQDAFYTHFAVFFTGSTLASILNFAFYPIMGRLLSPAAFGEIALLLSLMSAVSIAFGAFLLSAVHCTVNLDDSAQRKAALAVSGNFLLIASLILLTIGGVFSPWLKNYFQLSSYLTLAALGAYVLSNAAATVPLAYLQGTKQFSPLVRSSVMLSAARLVLAWFLVALGFGLAGGLWGIIASLVFWVWYVLRQASADSASLAWPSLARPDWKKLGDDLSYGFLVLCANGVTTFLCVLDVIAIKHYFSPALAGAYGGISAIARSIYFLLGPLSGVIVASIKIKAMPADNFRLLKKSMVLALLLGGAAFIVFILLAPEIIFLLLGEEYSGAARYAPWAGIIMLLSGVGNLLAYYFLALRRYFLVPASVGAVFLSLAGIWLWHDTITGVLSAIISGLVFFNAILVGAYAKDRISHYSRS